MSQRAVPGVVHHRPLLVVAVAFSLTLSGCSSAHSVALPAPRGASAQQVAALADGKVTRSEYEEAWRRYAACDAAAGYTIYKGYELNEVISGAIPDAAVKSGVDAKCELREFDGVSTAWQASRENTGPVNTAFKICLRDAGISPKTDESENYDLMKQAGIDQAACIDQHQPEIHPTLMPTN